MKSRKYRYMEHTADVEYIAYGRTMDECFTNALMALFDTISYKRKISLSRSKTLEFSIKDKARTIEDLLWYTLQDAVTIMDSKGVFGYNVAELKVKEGKGSYSISAKIKGKTKEDRTSKLDVKGVSKYNLKIKKSKGLIKASVVLDV